MSAKNLRHTACMHIWINFGKPEEKMVNQCQKCHVIMNLTLVDAIQLAVDRFTGDSVRGCHHCRGIKSTNSSAFMSNKCVSETNFTFSIQATMAINS